MIPFSPGSSHVWLSYSLFWVEKPFLGPKIQIRSMFALPPSTSIPGITSIPHPWQTPLLQSLAKSCSVLRLILDKRVKRLDLAGTGILGTLDVVHASNELLDDLVVAAGVVLRKSHLITGSPGVDTGEGEGGTETPVEHFLGKAHGALGHFGKAHIANACFFECANTAVKTSQWAGSRKRDNGCIYSAVWYVMGSCKKRDDVSVKGLWRERSREEKGDNLNLWNRSNSWRWTNDLYCSTSLYSIWLRLQCTRHNSKSKTRGEPQQQTYISWKRKNHQK